MHEMSACPSRLLEKDLACVVSSFIEDIHAQI